nr:hypothetical protein [uncultured Draconibacterium sp.]
MKVQRLNEGIFKPIPQDKMITILGGKKCKISAITYVDEGVVQIRTYKVKD